MRVLPTGTVTFLFSDIEGSTRLLQQTGRGFADLLAEHDRMMRRAIVDAGGIEVRTEGDAFFAAFPSATGAATAAVEAQRSLQGHTWPTGVELLVRIGMHTGDGVLGGDDYVGLDVHRAARIAASAHGGQIVASNATARLVEHDLPTGIHLRDLGEHALKDFEHAERIFQIDVAGLPSSFPPLATLDIPTNLPADLTQFVGRRIELAQAMQLLDGTRLLTLTGPGGAGKTRLAIKVASSMRDRFEDGVFFAGMEEITDATKIPGVLAEIVGAPPASGQDQTERLRSQLGANHVLLVLDNLEQVDDAAPVVGELLGGCPNTRVLATSRVPLRVSGEQEMGVPTMLVPSPADRCDAASVLEFDAVALFVSRASSVRPDFVVTEANCRAIVELCARLDGLPLAIEIAAARVKMLPPASILERLGSVLDSRGARNLPARQQTLRDAISWSHDLLDDPIRRLFARLSVFAGGAWLSELEAVGDDPTDGIDPLDGISELVDHSLLAQSVVLGEPRFRMLETIREFASEKLAEAGEADRTRALHAEVYLALAERAHPELVGPRSDQWLDRLSLDRHNFESALDWAIDSGNAVTAQRLVASFWRFWQMRGHLAEAMPKIESTLNLPGPLTATRARAMEAGGGVAYWLGDMETTRRHYEDALAYWKGAGDDAEIADALLNLSYPVGLAEEPASAIPILEEALGIYESLNHRLGQGRVTRMLGMIDAIRGNNAGWAHYGHRSLEYFDKSQEPFDFGWALFSVAGSSYLLGDVDASEQALREGLELFSKSTDISALLLFLGGFVQAAYSKEQFDRAARLAGAINGIHEDLRVAPFSGAFALPWFDDDVLRSLEERFPEPYAEGRTLSPDEALTLALEEPVS